jgi:hypothetical protein
MSDRHVGSDDLVLYHYGEAEDRAAIAEHLLACVECRASLESLRQVLAAVSEDAVPERGPDYGRHVFERLAPRLAAEGDTRDPLPRPEPVPARPRLVPSAPRLRPLLAFAATILVAFLLGRYTREPEIVKVAEPGPVRERVLLIAVGDHLDRAQMVLAELVHANGNGEVDISAEREWARDLVSANRLYRQTAASAGERGVVSVLDDLERVLVELATSPDALSSDELDALRQRIEAQGIVFKIRVLGSQVRQRQRTLLRAASRT